MKHLGFEISASPVAVSSEEDYKRSMSQDQLVGNFPEVVLVTTQVGETDNWSPDEVEDTELDRRRRLGAFHGNFRHLRGTERRVNTQ
jgi:hypothetical protein